ncbi:MAG: ImuA family protein [Chitinophagaceae bacterium]
MDSSQANRIAQLQKEILSLQGFKTNLNKTAIDMELGPINRAFPNSVFPLGAVHEYICESGTSAAATAGFILGITSNIMREGGVSLWISSSRTIFPPAMKSFGIDPDKFIFVDLQREKEILWVMEEALKCEGLAAVIGEVKELSFTASRRLQLAVEQSRVTGFVIQQNPRKLNTTACISRWKITSLASELEYSMPGVGFPRWNIDLLKVRNGKPGNWQVEWANQRFRQITKDIPTVVEPLQKKTG